MKTVVYSKTAQKALMRMPRNWAIRISEKIAAYANDPAAQTNNVTALQGSDGLSRLRVGDWRVVFTYDRLAQALTVLAVRRLNEGTYRD